MSEFEKIQVLGTQTPDKGLAINIHFSFLQKHSEK